MHANDLTGAQLRLVMPFKASPLQLGRLRLTVREQLAMWGMTASAEEATLAVTELATNVIKHVGAGEPATLVLVAHGESLRVEVHDTSTGLPQPHQVDCTAVCGRGLHMLAAMALDWGSVVSVAGKAIWFEFAVVDLGSHRRAERAIGAVAQYTRSMVMGAPNPSRVSAGLKDAAPSLIADLMHWCAQQGVDPSEVLDMAESRYEAQAGVMA